MRFVDFAIDLAAVLNASRGVAAKHVALRGRQLENYNRTSSVAAALRNRAAQRGAYERTAAAEESDEVVYEQAAPAAQATEPIVETPKDRVQTQEVKAEATRTEKTPFDGGIPSFRPNPLQQAAPKSTEEELDLPPGIDVNIFHTTRGSMILDQLKKKGRPGAPPPRPGARGPAKEHPLRNWPLPPPVQPEQSFKPAPEKPREAEVKVEETPIQPVTKPVEELATPAEEPVTPQPEETPKASIPAEEVAAPQPEAPSKPEPEKVDEKIDEEVVQAAKEIVGEPVPPQTPAYSLRESKVPSSRISRIWNYGGLAAGMLGGAMTEGVSRAFGGGGEGSILLSGKNMERLVAKLSRMRGAALKLGQMMSFQDTKMLPAPIQEVLQRVQDRADYMPAWQRDRVLAANLGAEWRDLFSEFEEKPIAAASGAQGGPQERQPSRRQDPVPWCR